MLKRAGKEMWICVDCDVGDYLAYVEGCDQIETPWKRNTNQFGFSVYGKSSVDLRLAWSLALPATFVSDLLLQKCMLTGAELRSVKDIHYRYELSTNGFGYFFFENRAKSQIYLIAIQLTAPLMNCNFSSRD